MQEVSSIEKRSDRAQQALLIGRIIQEALGLDGCTQSDPLLADIDPMSLRRIERIFPFV